MSVQYRNKLLVATRNPGKLGEILALLGQIYAEIVNFADYPNVSVEETGPTFEENAKLKAIKISAETGHLTLAEDSGIEVDALDGRPGILSARYAPTPDECNKKILEELKNVTWERRTCRYRCVAALARNGTVLCITRGICPGIVTLEPKGTNGFGYDPLFYLPDFDTTMAELPDYIKNSISHRAKAMTDMRSYLVYALRR